MTPIEIGRRIALRRKELDLTLQEVADRVHVARSTVQRYEAGTIAQLKLPVLFSIAQALRVNPDWLIGKSDIKELPDAPLPGVSPEGRELINNDPELTEYLEYLATRSEMRMLFHVTKDATKEQIEAIVKMVESMSGRD